MSFVRASVRLQIERQRLRKAAALWTCLAVTHKPAASVGGGHCCTLLGEGESSTFLRFLPSTRSYKLGIPRVSEQRAQDEAV